MTPAASGLLLLVFYAVGVLLVALIAVWVRRPIPRTILAVLSLLPFLFLGGGVFSRQTLLPVDHVRLVPPWMTQEEVRRYNPYLNDVATQYLPWAQSLRKAWAEGSAPWRDRWNGCGTPLAANGQAAAFSPTTLLSLPLPLPSAFVLIAALRLFLALSGMWLWLRVLEISTGAALFGSVSFAFSFAMIPWLFAPHSGVVCLWPWILFALERQRDPEARDRALGLLVGVFALLPLSGHAESAACGVLFAALWVFARWISRDLPDTPRLSGRVAAAALLALGLTAFSLLPQVFAILSSNRIVLAARPFWSAALSWRPHGPAWNSAAYTTFLPRALGDAIESPLVIGSTASFIEMAMGYIGVVGWGCAALLLRSGSKRRKAAWCLLVPAAFAVGSATAIWPFAEITGHLPLLRFIFPIRLLALVALSGAALAAMELDRLLRDLRERRKAGVDAVLVFVLFAIWIAMVAEHVRPRHAPSAFASQSQALQLAEVVLGVSAVFLLAAFWRRRSWGAVLPYALSAVGAAELWIQGSRLYRYGDAAGLFPSTPLVEFLGRQPPPFRVVAEDGVLFPNTNVFAGVEDIRTHDPVERRDYVEFLDATVGYPPAEYFKMLANLSASSLDFLNVRFLISIPGRESPGPKWRPVYAGADGTVFENRNVLPSVFAPRRLTLVASSSRRQSGWARNAFEDFRSPASALSAKRDWAEHAFFLSDASKTIENGAADLSEYRESTNQAFFRARISGQEAFLVTSLVQDGGWSAREEGGGRIEVSRANGPFLGLRVPKGEHRISLTYRPPGFPGSVWVSAASLAAAAWVAGRWRRRGRRDRLTVTRAAPRP